MRKKSLYLEFHKGQLTGAAAPAALGTAAAAQGAELRAGRPFHWEAASRHCRWRRGQICMKLPQKSKQRVEV